MSVERWSLFSTFIYTKCSQFSRQGTKKTLVWRSVRLGRRRRSVDTAPRSVTSPIWRGGDFRSFLRANNSSKTWCRSEATISSNLIEFLKCVRSNAWERLHKETETRSLRLNSNEEYKLHSTVVKNAPIYLWSVLLKLNKH